MLALSKAILEGMRHLKNVILISETWFEDIDISIVSENSEILTAKITHFNLHDPPSRNIFSKWRIFRACFDNIEYTSTISFDTSENDPEESAAPADSIFIDIYEPTSQFYLKNNKDLAGIEVIYWRGPL